MPILLLLGGSIVDGASESLSLGAKLVIAVAVCSLLIVAFKATATIVRQQTGDVTKINNGARELDFKAFDDQDVSGYDLWDEFRSMRGKRINGEDFYINISTKTFSDMWLSSDAIGDIISDDPSADNYVSEDSMFHCTLIRSDGKSGDVIGINAELVIE